MPSIEERLATLNIVLPSPVAPVANYVPFVRSGNLLYISGQVSIDPTGGIKGVVGEDVDLEGGQAAARLCAINLIAQMKLACGGDLEQVRRVVKLGGFVQAGPDFLRDPKGGERLLRPDGRGVRRSRPTRAFGGGRLSAADKFRRRS